MYLNFYHLKKEPFNVTPDPEFLFLSGSHKEALGSVLYGVEKRKGFIAITGEVGLGKTTILRSFLEMTNKQQLKIIYIFNPNVSFKELLNVVYREIGINHETNDISDMVNHLHQVLIEEYNQKHNVVLIIDEAQNMPIETLESLRMLSNLETSTEKLIQIVLVGQPEFENMLNQNELRQLNQRIAVKATIAPLSQEDSVAYILHRLSKAIDKGVIIFTQKAMKLIVNNAKGTPRIINILCDNALINGYGYQQKQINTKIVKEVISGFEGNRRYSFLRWKLALPVIIILFAGVVGTYKYAHLDLFNFKKHIIDPITQTETIKNEAKPLIENAAFKPTIESIYQTKIEQELTNTEIIQSTMKNSLKIENIPIGEETQKLTNRFDSRTKIVKKQYTPTDATEERAMPFNEGRKSDKIIFDNDQLLNNKKLSRIKDIENQENPERRNLLTKLESEKWELEKLKSRYQERIDAVMSQKDKFINKKLQLTPEENLNLPLKLVNSD